MNTLLLILVLTIPTAGQLQLTGPRVDINGVDILADKSGPFVHLHWTVAGPPRQHLVFRGSIGTFDTVTLIGITYADSFDDPVLADGNNYFYQVFRVDP